MNPSLRQLWECEKKKKDLLSRSLLLEFRNRHSTGH